MNLRETLATACQAMYRHPLYGLLTLFGLGIGIAAMVVTLTLRQGMSAEWQRHAPPPGANRLEIFPGTEHAGPPDSAQPSTLTEADVIALRGIDGIALVAGSVRQFSKLAYYDETWPVSVYAVDPDYFAIHEWTLQGSFGASDSADKKARDKNNIAVIGTALRDKKFSDVDPMGKEITIDNIDFHIAGVVSASDTNAFFGDSATSVFVPLRNANGMLKLGSDALRRISIRTTVSSDARVVQTAITALLRQRHGIGAAQQDDFQVRNFSAFAVAVNKHPHASPGIVAVIGLIALLLGGAALARGMFVSVTDRATEIGLRIATGARARAIQTQFLIEAVMIAIVGGMLGILFGVAVLLGIGYETHRSLYLRISVLLAGLLVASLVGVLFGFMPARKAARLDAAAALRFE